MWSHASLQPFRYQDFMGGQGEWMQTFVWISIVFIWHLLMGDDMVAWMKHECGCNEGGGNGRAGEGY